MGCRELDISSYFRLTASTNTSLDKVVNICAPEKSPRGFNPVIPVRVSNYRYYSHELGRWLSRDPIGEWGGENLYGFVSNNPVSKIDYLGLADPGWWNPGADTGGYPRTDLDPSTGHLPPGAVGRWWRLTFTLRAPGDPTEKVFTPKGSTEEKTGSCTKGDTHVFHAKIGNESEWTPWKGTEKDEGDPVSFDYYKTMGMQDEHPTSFDVYAKQRTLYGTQTSGKKTLFEYYQQNCVCDESTGKWSWAITKTWRSLKITALRTQDLKYFRDGATSKFIRFEMDFNDINLRP